MDDDQELRARIEAQVAARRPGTPSSSSEAGENDAGERNGAGDEDHREVGGPAEPDETPGHLRPIRPWLLQGAKPSAPSPPSAAPTPEPPGAGRPVEPGAPGEPPRPLDPTRPWLKQGQPAEPPSRPPVPRPSGERSRVLDPTRPWLAEKPAPPEAPALSISPRPSNSASVLEPLVAEIQAAADRAAGRRRGFFRRRAATEQAPSPAPLEPRHAVAPGQASWPITFESDELAASAFRVLGEPSASVGADDPLQAGRLRKAAHWLFEQAPEPADELSTPAGGSSAPARAQPEVGPVGVGGPDQPGAEAEEPDVLPVSAGSDLARRLAAPSLEPADEQPAAGGVLHRLFHRRALGTEDEPAVVALPPRIPMRPTVAWDELRSWRGAEPAEQPLRGEPVPVEQAPPAVEPAAAEPEPEPTPAPEPAPVPQPEPTPAPVAEPAPEPAVLAQPARPRPRPRPYASAPRLDADAPTLAGPAVPGTGPDQLPKPDKGGPDRTHKNLRWLVRTAITLLIVVIAAVLLRVFVLAPYYIPSASMEPTLHGCNGCNNDHVLVDKLSYRMHDIHRGDVVVFNRPSTWQVSEKTLVKRVVGLPGDTLTVSSGKLFVNGLEIEEPYVNSKCPPMSTLAESPAKASKTFGPIPDGEVYVMGDNRCDSSDSRAFGPVPDSKVVGRAFVIIWPLGRIHYL